MSMETWLQKQERELESRIPGPPWESPSEFDPTGRAPNEPGAKLDAGKQMAGVLLDFAHALSAVADVGTMGANKYSRGGWKSVPNGQQRYLDAAMRHMLKHGQGELHDPESGLTHLAHATWNLLAIAELQERAQSNCAALIIQSGITRVVYEAPDPAFMVRWKDSIAESFQMFEEARVTVVSMEV